MTEQQQQQRKTPRNLGLMQSGIVSIRFRVKKYKLWIWRAAAVPPCTAWLGNATPVLPLLSGRAEISRVRNRHSHVTSLPVVCSAETIESECCYGEWLFTRDYNIQCWQASNKIEPKLIFECKHQRSDEKPEASDLIKDAVLSALKKTHAARLAQAGERQVDRLRLTEQRSEQEPERKTW